MFQTLPGLLTGFFWAKRTRKSRRRNVSNPSRASYRFLLFTLTTGLMAIVMFQTLPGLLTGFFYPLCNPWFFNQLDHHFRGSIPHGAILPHIHRKLNFRHIRNSLKIKALQLPRIDISIKRRNHLFYKALREIFLSRKKRATDPRKNLINSQKEKTYKVINH